MKGSAITGPVGKEAAELWPVSFFSRFKRPLKDFHVLTFSSLAYCQQLRCRHVKRLLNEGRDFFFIYYQREERNEKKTNDQVPRCDLIEAWKSSFPASCPFFSDFFVLWGMGGGKKKRESKVAGLAGSCISVAACKDDSISGIASNGQRQKKKYPSPSLFLINAG